jgi:hypothetical protein
MYKIIGADGKEYGPITTDQLRQWLAEGRLNMQSRVLVEGTTEWKTIGDLPEFAATAPAAPPLAPGVLPSGTASTGAVDGPAIGLIVVAILGFFAQVASIIWQLFFAAGMAASMAANQPAMPFGNMKMFSGTISVVFGAIGIATSILIFFGGLKMKKLENYGLAMAASVIAMIPCISPCCLLGLPIGIWALVVLSKPEVKSAFH